MCTEALTHKLACNTCQHARICSFARSLTRSLHPRACLPIRLSIRSPVGWQNKAKGPASAHLPASKQRFASDDAARQFSSVSRVPSCTSDPYEASEIAASAEASSDYVSDDYQVYPAIDTEQVCSHPHVWAPEVAQLILAISSP